MIRIPSATGGGADVGRGVLEHRHPRRTERLHPPSHEVRIREDDVRVLGGRAVAVHHGTPSPSAAHEWERSHASYASKTRTSRVLGMCRRREKTCADLGSQIQRTTGPPELSIARWTSRASQRASRVPNGQGCSMATRFASIVVRTSSERPRMDGPMSEGRRRLTTVTARTASLERSASRSRAGRVGSRARIACGETYRRSNGSFIVGRDQRMPWSARMRAPSVVRSCPNRTL